MKHTRKTLLLIALLLLISAALLGCDTIPEEYTTGVKLDRDYPEDDMPIIDDALVYFSENDDDEITVRYGTGEDLDDVADFYKDFFEENEIVLDDETDKSSKYTAEGYYKDFYFEIKVSTPSGEHEEKLFAATVKIEIVFGEAASSDNPTLEEKLIGFWRQESIEKNQTMVNILDQGKASDISADGTITAYDNFTWLGTASWEVVDENTFHITSAQGDLYVVTVSFEIRDGVDYLIWEDGEGVFELFRDSLDGLTNYPEPTSEDIALASKLQDIPWSIFSFEEDGTIIKDDTRILFLNSNGNFEYSFNDSTGTGTWRISENNLHQYFNDDSIGYIITTINYHDIDGAIYISAHGGDSDSHWLFSDDPYSIKLAPTDFVDTTWTLASDIVDGHVLLHDRDVTYIFNADETVERVTDGTVENGRWGISGETLSIWMPDADVEEYEFIIRTKYGIDYIYLIEPDYGYEDHYQVLTNPSTTQGVVTFTSDEQMTKAIAEIQWELLHYVYADGSIDDGLTPHPMLFHADGTFEETYNGEYLTGTWYISEGVLYFTHNSTGETYIIQMYMEFDPLTKSIKIYDADLEEGYEGGYWVYTSS